MLMGLWGNEICGVQKQETGTITWQKPLDVGSSAASSEDAQIKSVLSHVTFFEDPRGMEGENSGFGWISTHTHDGNSSHSFCYAVEKAAIMPWDCLLGELNRLICQGLLAYSKHSMSFCYYLYYYLNCWVIKL